MRNLVLTIALIVLATPAAHSADAIKIAMNDRTGQKVVARIAGAALQKAGFDVDYVDVPAASQYSEIAAGHIHIQPDATGIEASADYRAALATGKIVDVGQWAAESGDRGSRKIMWTGVNRKWPGAAKLLRNMSIRTADQVAMAAEIDDKGRDMDEVVGEWMAGNAKRWKFWTAASTNWMKQ